LISTIFSPFLAKSLSTNLTSASGAKSSFSHRRSSHVSSSWWK